MRGTVFCLAAAVLLAGCAHGPRRRAPPLGVGALVDAHGGRVTPQAFLDRAAEADFILIGEAHDNACDHAQEARLAELTAGARPSLIGLEMVAVDRQPVLDRFNAGELAPSSLPEALDWNHTWGFPFDMYAPIFAVASHHQAGLIALNAPTSIERTVRDGGLESLPASQRQDITPRLIPPPPEEEAMLRQAFAAHAAQGAHGGGDEAWRRFVRVQSFWDSQMAWRAADAHERWKRPMIIIAGGGHIEHGWGIEYRLRQFAPGARTLSIMPLRLGEELEPAVADLFYVCPATEEKGPPPMSAR